MLINVVGPFIETGRRCLFCAVICLKSEIESSLLSENYLFSNLVKTGRKSDEQAALDQKLVVYKQSALVALENLTSLQTFIAFFLLLSESLGNKDSANEQTGIKMSLTTSSCKCVTILLLLSGVLGVKDWKVTYEKPHICALKGSSVTIPCSYQYPRGHRVNETFWINKRETNKDPEDLKQDQHYHDRVTYLGDKSEDCTFRIENVEERDSATYWFRLVTDQVGGKWIGEPGVTLSVTALQVEKSQPSATSQATLTCKNTCFPKVHNDYVWFRDGKYVLNQYDNVLVPEENGMYSCALRRSENVQSAPVKVSMEYSPKNTSVSVSPSGEILEGSSVTLTCNNKANPPVYRYTWFKNGAEISQSGSQKNYYTITNIRSEDSGKYRCVARNTHGTGTSKLYSVDVQYSPKNTLVSISPSGDILEGSSVTLTCNSKANPPVDTYSWFKNGAEISQRGSMQDYDITNITSEDSGEYYCVATNTRGTGTSGVYTVNVLCK
ncbi:B-cell receptor CD22-like isoform X2 [Scleropages formosus]|uniref:B-cell receptor CD22-like isoform X2 n=1 Tax=Scleropages formosus TaxID=113540 RepID=UPI0010FA9227|nr:B-cell receptor CD22-like isoform X2 [Scleropages formosus]